MGNYSRNNCPYCNDKALISVRYPERGQCYGNTDKPLVYQMYQVKCFLGCGFQGPEHRWSLDYNGEPCSGSYCSSRYHSTPEKARKRAMEDWNKICGALKGVFHD